MIREFFKRILRFFMLSEKKKKAHRASGFERDEEKHRHEIPSKEISERFGRAIERLADK